MTTADDNIAAKVKRFPAELQPNPDYRYEPPKVVVVDGVRCIEVDAGVIAWARDIADRGAKFKFPRKQ